MAKLAIDVVLLPSEEMMDKAIEINKELLKDNVNEIVLSKETCLPHISLCMGVIEEEKLPEIKKVIEETAKEFSTFNLTAENTDVSVTPKGEKISVLIIRNTDTLQKLHETVMKRLWNFLSYDVEAKMFYNPGKVREKSINWVRNYAKKYNDPSLFDAHITVGFGETDKFKFPIEFTASRLALCHLGSYCTCRKILISTNLT